MTITLLKPYSIWTKPLFSQRAKQDGHIAVFHFENGMWKEFRGGLVGISDAHMAVLVKVGLARIDKKEGE